MVRGNANRKRIALVVTGDEFADGGHVIRNVLKQNRVKASFFFTGRFYRNPDFGPLIKRLKSDGHYLGSHSDQHLLYCDWVKRDSLLVTYEQFSNDLQQSYREMARFGIKKKQAFYFLPPYEWYNSRIAEWVERENLQLINFTPGTRSTADYTYPEMGKAYRSSVEIRQSVLVQEEHGKGGLNGFILLIHIGTDPRRKDKFYDHLDEIIKILKMRGYLFEKLNNGFFN